MIGFYTKWTTWLKCVKLIGHLRKNQSHFWSSSFIWNIQHFISDSIISLFLQFVDLCILLGCDYCDSIKGSYLFNALIPSF